MHSLGTISVQAYMPYILGSIYRNQVARSSGFLASSAPLDVKRTKALSTLRGPAELCCLGVGGNTRKSLLRFKSCAERKYL